jgi:hypothetical protein
MDDNEEEEEYKEQEEGEPESVCDETRCIN